MGFDYFPSHCPLLSPFLSYVPFLLSTSFFLLLCCMCVHTRETMNYFCLSRPVYLCLPWSRSIHVPASDIFVFFSMVPLWIQTTVLYFPLDGHLGWFFNLVIVNSPVVNMDDWIYLDHTVWDFYPNRVYWKDNASSPSHVSTWPYLRIHLWGDWNQLNWVQGCGQLTKMFHLFPDSLLTGCGYNRREMHSVHRTNCLSFWTKW